MPTRQDSFSKFRQKDRLFWSLGIIPNCLSKFHKLPRVTFGQSARLSRTGTSRPANCDDIEIKSQEPHNSNHLHHVSRAQSVMIGGSHGGQVVRLMLPGRGGCSDGVEIEILGGKPR